MYHVIDAVFKLSHLLHYWFREWCSGIALEFLYPWMWKVEIVVGIRNENPKTICHLLYALEQLVGIMKYICIKYLNINKKFRWMVSWTHHHEYASSIDFRTNKIRSCNIAQVDTTLQIELNGYLSIEFWVLYVLTANTIFCVCLGDIKCSELKQ